MTALPIAVRLVALLAKEVEPMTPKVLALRLHVTPGAVRIQLRRCAASGIVERSKNNHGWQLTTRMEK